MFAVTSICFIKLAPVSTSRKADTQEKKEKSFNGEVRCFYSFPGLYITDNGPVSGLLSPSFSYTAHTTTHTAAYKVHIFHTNFLLTLFARLKLFLQESFAQSRYIPAKPKLEKKKNVIIDIFYSLTKSINNLK